MARQRKREDVTHDQDDKLQRIRSGVPKVEKFPNPLGPEHLNALNEVIRECEQTGELCKCCQDAGIDVDPEIATNNEQLKMAVTLKRHFFPHST